MTIDQQIHDHLVPLSNEGWGIEYNCFVCEPRNASGLGISFHHDIAGVRGAIIRYDGRRCATATATFVSLDLAQLGDAAGAEIPDAAVAYTTGGAR